MTLARLPEPSTDYVYAALDPRTLDVVYVGLTGDPTRRAKQHLMRSAWCTKRHRFIILAKVERGGTAIERAAIIKYRPRHNIQSNPTYIGRPGSGAA